MPIKKYLFAALSIAAFTTIAYAADQEQPTPYDLIRPVYPLTWDSTVFDHFVPDAHPKNPIPSNRTPASYVPNALVPDTLNQAYLDAMNYRMSPIRVNQAGYLEKDLERQFYYVGTATTFEVVDIDGNSLSPKQTGTLTSSGQTTSSSWIINAGTNAATNYKDRYSVTIPGQSGTIQIGHLPQGLPTNTRLRIKVGNDISSTFIISDKVYSMVRSAALKFYGINRSGDSESWFHPASHTKDGMGPVVVGSGDDASGASSTAITPKAGDLQGGWYDCGDHLKESQTMMYAFMVAAVMAAANPDADEDNYAYNHGETVNTDGIPDMLREAKHGADFVLRAYDVAGGVIDNMALSIGNFGADHGWWGRPENQDNIPSTTTGRGGPHERDVRLGELGSNISSEAAAGLAILSVDYAQYDAEFAAKCLKVAKELYDFAKNLSLGKTTYGDGKPFVNNKVAAGWSSAAYNGNNEDYDDLGLAAICLFYATKDKTYLNDAVEDESLRGAQYKDGYTFTAGSWRGGWFVHKEASLLKSGKNTSWANAYTYTLYAFYKLILKSNERAAEYGLTEAQRLEYAEDVAYNMIYNLQDMSGDGSASITLPQGSLVWKGNVVRYDPIWYTMFTDGTWIYNRYQAGNIVEVLAYADVTKDLEGLKLPQKGVQDWKSAEMFQLGINQLNYMLGVNPWDVSFLLGIGDKNDAHPHHRAANPEGKNVPGAAYKYNPPVGALFGGQKPGATNDWDPGTRSWEEYHLSETCIDAAATFVSAGMLTAQKIDRTAAPEVSVEIRHVSMDSAIVMVKLSTRGNAYIYYGTEEGKMVTAAVADAGTPAVQHEIVLRGLQNGTTYYFYAIGQNAYDESNMTFKYMVDSTKTPYSFTTLNTVESAQIANVTVCNLSGDSAEIMWYTPNGEYESKVYWDTIPHATAAEYAYNSGSGNADVSGIPTKFHYVKIGGLSEKTTYYFMVESNGQYASVDSESGDLLKFTTPVTQYDFSVKAYQYHWQDMSMLAINVFNNESRAFDSLTIRLYMRGTEDIVTDIGMGTDICQAYDEAGFNNPCSDETKEQLERALRDIQPKKIEDTYDAATGTWQWYFPLELGSTVIKSSSRMRFDVRFDHRSPWPPYKDLMNEAPNKKLYCRGTDGRWYSPSQDYAGADVLDENPGDWSWMPHSGDYGKTGEYPGMPCEDKDAGDMDFDAAPVNPNMAVYRKDEFVWGYSPSYQEMTTKKADYKIEVTLDEPFNVSNNSYVQIDQTSGTVYVKGYASITEGGYITKIWVNGSQIEGSVVTVSDEIYFVSNNNEIIAHYNKTAGSGPIDSTGLWSLNIPVKMKIGSNKIDLTIFAGADPECEACSENGGCAFVNRTYYVQFTRGNLTASNLTIKDESGNPVASPADPANTRFYIYLTDKDKAGTSAPVEVLVVNSKKNDTLKVKMVEDASNPGTFKSSAAITALSVAPESRSGNQISFFAGDTIQVIYIDPDDEEDVSKQSFYAESKYPEPQRVYATDTDCDNVADKLVVEFSNTLEAAYSFDSVRVYLSGMADTVTLKVDQAAALNQSVVSVDLPASLGIEKTAAPSGQATIYLKADGATNSEHVTVADGIAPQLMSVTILENPEHENEEDQLMVAFTEPVMLASDNTWLVDVVGGSTANIQVVGKATTSNDGKSWRYKVIGNTDGQILKEGLTVRIRANTVQDKSFNLLNPDEACTEVKIVETPAPVPVTLAEMRDNEGDGYPDELYMKFEKVLRTKDMLDSFVVVWGSKGETKSFLPPWHIDTLVDTRTENIYDTVSTSATFGSVIGTKEVSDSVSVFTVAIPTTNSYAKGATSGPFDGYGRVTPRLGPEGGFFDTSYVVVDKCPPIILSATWKKTADGDDSDGDYGAVTLTFSEPLDTVPTQPYVVERYREGQVGKVFFSPKQNPNLVLSYSAKSTTAQLRSRENYVEAVWVDDSVRLVPDGTTSYFKDLAGQYAGYGTPWVYVTGSVDKVRLTVSLEMEDGVARGRQKDSVYYGGAQLAQNENFRLTGDTKDGKTVVIAAGESELHDVFSAPIENYRHAGPVFKLVWELPDLGDSTDLNEAMRDYDLDLDLDLFTNLGTFINQASYRTMSSMLKDFTSGPYLTLYLEWCAPEDYPVSSEGKKIGTGPYIAKYQYEAKSEYKASTTESSDGKTKYRTDTFKGSDVITKTFGFRRSKK